ncbi:MAG: cyclic nucleotide-binding domain-containing protein [Desulfobacter sp.]|nr:cyclic nucleotide-binding domain-containing protein [Desulfobacter sp.]WDP85651.1 MAG: cyclic nucleotide-binding domain-containing protein [Desulfobacter sp.]
MQKKILGLLKIYEEEISILLWATALLFIVRSSGIILNNYAETAFLKRYGVEFMPVVNMLNAVVTLFITGFLTTLLNRMSGARLLAYVFLASGLLVTGIRLLIPFGFDILYPILFMLKSQFELLQALLFWNMCNDLFNTRQSKRLFPLLTAGGVIGLILGSVGTPYFAKWFNLDNLLYLYLATTLTGMIIVRAMGRSYASLIFQEKTGQEAKKKKSMFQEIQDVYPLVKDSILVKIVLVLTFMPNVVVPIMNYQFNYAIDDQFASEAAMIQFFGYFRGGLYTISLFILLFVGRIYGRWGLPVALMFHPFNYMIAFTAFLFRFDMFSAMYARMSTNILRTTINVPANGILIGLFPESYRNMIRPFLRGTVVRLALFTGSGIILISDSLFHPKYLSLVALPFVLVWLGAPFILKAKYASILKDLISNNLLDIKRFSPKEISHIFNQDKVLKDLKASFLSARGPDVIWYAKLLKNFSEKTLDENILACLADQDETTQVALIKMISETYKPEAAKKLVTYLDPKTPETTIAILKLVCQQGFTAARGRDLRPYVQSTHPVVRGFAAACLYAQNPVKYKSLIDQWLNSDDMDQRQSGIISAGLSRDREYIDILLKILSKKKIDPIIPDIIIALSRLEAKELNSVIFSYLSYDLAPVRLAALDALTIDNDTALKKTISLIADISQEIRSFAKEKIKRAEYRNNTLLVESLGLPGSRIRRGIFELLEHMDIKEFDILMFAKEQITKSYTYLAMGETIRQMGPTPGRALAVEHLNQKKEMVLENIIRVLAIHDKSGKMKTAWRGIFSPDTRQRANAIELVSDVLDRKTFNAMVPLLESPSPQIALEQGQPFIKMPEFDPKGQTVIETLLNSQDWVDVIMGLAMVHEAPDIFDLSPMADTLKSRLDKIISKEAKMILNTSDQKRQNGQRIGSTEISMGEKILLLKEIDIFSGLSAAELAAIAAETKELDYQANETVIKQDKMGETVFLVIDGRVEVIKELSGDKEVVLDHIESGGAFGEMALIDDAPRSATIKTVTPCRFLILHKQEFKETAMEFPRISLQICSVLSQRIRYLHGKFEIS